MIESNLGKVKITCPNYDLCKILDCSKTDVDAITEAMLGADLTSILGALGDRYGTEHAMEIWTHSAEVYIETMKGETT